MREIKNNFGLQTQSVEHPTHHYVKTITNGDIYNAVVEVFVNDELVTTIHRCLSSAFEFKEAIHELNSEGFSAVVQHRTYSSHVNDNISCDTMSGEIKNTPIIPERVHFTISAILEFVGDNPDCYSLFRFWHANMAQASGSYTRADGTDLTIYSIELKTQYNYDLDKLSRQLGDLTHLVNTSNSYVYSVTLVVCETGRFVSLEFSLI